MKRLKGTAGIGTCHRLFFRACKISGPLRGTKDHTSPSIAVGAGLHFRISQGSRRATGDRCSQWTYDRYCQSQASGHPNCQCPRKGAALASPLSTRHQLRHFPREASVRSLPTRGVGAHSAGRDGLIPGARPSRRVWERGESMPSAASPTHKMGVRLPGR